jgi:hypothetical protein
MKTQISFLLLILMTSLSLQSWSQEGKWSYYLEGTQIYSISEDRDGNLWMATSRDKAKNFELIKYDGKNWQKIENCPITNPAVVFAASDNTIWVSSGLCLKNKNDQITWVAKFDGNKWTTYTKDQNLNVKYVLKFYEDSNHRIWILPYHGGVTTYDGNKFEKLSDYRKLNPCITESDDGTIWIGGKELMKYDGKELTTFPYEGVVSLTTDKDNNLLFGKLAGRVGTYNGSDFSVQKLGGSYYGNRGMAACMIFGILPGLAAGLIHTSIDHFTTVYTDRNKNIWVAARGGGGLFKKSGDTWINYKNDINKGKKISSITEDKQGNIWIVTMKKTISSFDGSKWTNYQNIEGLKKIGLDKRAIYPQSVPISLCLADSKGNIWIATMNGLIKHSPEGGNLSKIDNN